MKIGPRYQLASILLGLGAVGVVAIGLRGSVAPRRVFDAPSDGRNGSSIRQPQRSSSLAPASRARALARARVVAGRVRREQGEAIPGASVCVSSALNELGLDCTTSDRTGSFALEATGTDEVRLTATAAGYLPAARALEGDQLDSITLVLEPGGERLEGRVVDATGGPIAGAIVAVAPPNHPAFHSLSNAAGAFVFGLPPGAVQVTASAEGYASDSIHTLVPESGLKLVLAPASSIAGRVTVAGSETAVAGVLVRAVETGVGRIAPSSVLSDPEGHFSFPSLAAGNYDLSASAAAWHGTPTQVPLGVSAVVDDVVLEVAPATQLDARVLRAGSPCDAGWVHLSGRAYLSGAISEEGLARIEGIPPGRYRVDVLCPPGVPQRDELVVSQEALSRQWDLDLGLSVRGIVESTSGEPLAGVEVTVSSSADGEGLTSACTSDTNGVFECRGLREGPYTSWVARSLPTERSIVRVDVSEGESPLVRLVAPDTGAILVRAGGNDPAAVDVVARAVNGLVTLGRPEARGVLFAPLELGDYELNLAARETGGKHVRLTRADEVVEVELPEVALATLAGRVVDERAQPVADAWVRALPSESAMGAPLRPIAPVLSDAEGSFALEGLIAGGVYELEVNAAHGRADLPSVHAGERDIVIRLPTSSSIVARISNPRGEPLERFTLSAQRRADGQAALYRGHDGVWSDPSIRPGAYLFKVSSAQGSAEREVDVAPDAQLTLSFVVAPTGPNALGGPVWGDELD
ncbi:MAG: hypothetical protein RL033_3874 [Pseudomonadota bacterium]